MKNTNNNFIANFAAAAGAASNMLSVSLSGRLV